MRSSAACSALAKRAYAVSVRRAAATDASTAPLARPITRASPSHERQRARRSDRARIQTARMAPMVPQPQFPAQGGSWPRSGGVCTAAPPADLRGRRARPGELEDGDDADSFGLLCVVGEAGV